MCIIASGVDYEKPRYCVCEVSVLYSVTRYGAIQYTDSIAADKLDLAPTSHQPGNCCSCVRIAQCEVN